MPPGRLVGFLLGLPADGLMLLVGLQRGSSDALEGFSDGRSVGRSVGTLIGLDEGTDVGLDVRELTLPVGRVLLLLEGRSVDLLLGLPADGPTFIQHFTPNLPVLLTM
jgi:hypothetical protein